MKGEEGRQRKKRPFVLRALAASTFSSLFFDEREASEKRARANDGSLGAGEKKGPLVLPLLDLCLSSVLLEHPERSLLAAVWGRASEKQQRGAKEGSPN